jgi:hypothetical protein
MSVTWLLNLRTNDARMRRATWVGAESMDRLLITRVLLTVAAVALVASASLGQNRVPTSTVVAACDFEGPYSTGDNPIQAGCTNNWQWGRKDMVLRADQSSGRPGTAQMVQTRGIASGGVQFFYTRLPLQPQRYYRVSYWLRSDGLEGPLRCHVRLVGYPWTDYLYEPFITRTSEWRQYVFTGKTGAEIGPDPAVCWETGSLGTFWIDDLKVEESEQPFPMEAVKSAVDCRPGNMLPRSSCEGRRDRFWSTLSFGGSRDGVWEGVETDWEDPQMYRAEGGKVGRYCMAVPSAAHAGQAAAISVPLAVLPGRPYTLSMWMKASEDDYPCSAALLYWQSGRHHQAVAGVSPKLTTEWQRVSLTTTPEPPPGSTDTTSPITVVVQIASAQSRKGVVYVDGLQLEAADTPTDYQPAYPLELYADIGQDGGNLVEWGQKVPLSLLVAAADRTGITRARVEVTVIGYPDAVVWRKTLWLPVNKERPLTLDIRRHGLFRVQLRPLNATQAAPQELLFAVVPPPRQTGEKGMFGTHIALRPFLVDYIRRLGFTWTRLHDCSLLTKWEQTEREPGKLLWHDDVVDGVIGGGINILGLPDSAPAWATSQAEGASPVNAEAYGRYCEQAARHYAGKISYWELWNEPYMGMFFSGGVDQFSPVLEAGYAGIKRGNPQATVLGWCADVSNPAWGQGLTEPARQSIDIFSFHNYINNLSGGGTLPFAAELPEHRKLWPARVTECWNTEGTNGALCANSFYSDELLYDAQRNEQATAFASRVWVEHARAGIAKCFIYMMHNTDTMMYNGGYQSLLIGYDRTPTPAAIATATTAYCIDGLKFEACRPTPGIVQAAFGGPGRASWVVYDDGGVIGRRRLNLAQLPPEVQVLDVMGNDPRADGREVWEIGISPLFLLSSRLSARELAAAGRSALVR